MLFNYFKIAYRNLIRNTIYSFINIAGLSLGIACSILISLWVINEVTYDRFHSNINELHIVRTNVEFANNEMWTQAGLPAPLYRELKTKYGEIKNATITSDGNSRLLTHDDKKIYKEGRCVSPEFLQLFRFPLVQGNADQVLNDPLSIVLTASTANALFGDQDPINKTIKIDNRYDVTVTGILKDIPDNSSFAFDYLLPFAFYQNTASWVKECSDDWTCDTFEIYAELQPNTDLASINQKIKNLILHRDDRFKSKELFLYPMNRWQLYYEFENGKESSSNQINYVISFSALAVGIIFMACINFMNLATARSERRAREVGIRKIVGSRRKQLIYQFLGEAILISTIAFLLALAIVEMSMPFYNELIRERFFIDYSSPFFWLVGLALVLFTGLLSGSYPAFYLSSFSPAKILKGKMHIGKSGILPRKLLVIFQFGFSISLICGTIIIYQQIQFVKSRQMGYDKSNLVTIQNNPELAKNYRTIKAELLQTGVVRSVTKTNSAITEIYEYNFLNWSGNPGAEANIVNIYAEYDYLKTMGIKLLEGRDFSELIKTDTGSVILNKAAIDLMNLKRPLGASVAIGGSPKQIIGITENVLMESPYEHIEPMYIVLETEWTQQRTGQNITMRLANSKDLKTQLGKVETIFKALNPSYPFQYSFVDDDFNRKFRTITLVEKLTNVFAFLAIFIASLGLFGLAAFSAERRTKEFGVRKVLGASVANLVSLISKDFVRLILIAFVIFTPLAWYILNQFLQRYSYRIAIDWKIFFVSGLSVLLVSLLIVGTQAVKAASTNPVESLKNE